MIIDVAFDCFKDDKGFITTERCPFWAISISYLRGQFLIFMVFPGPGTPLIQFGSQFPSIWRI